MAVIRPTGTRRFRHFGSPEQGRRIEVRSVQESPMAQEKPDQHEPEMTREEMQQLLSKLRPQVTLGTFIMVMARRWVTMVLAGWAISLVIALVSSPLMWWGWNHGIASVTGLPTASWPTMYCVTLFVTALAGLFRSQLTVNQQEQ